MAGAVDRTTSFPDCYAWVLDESTIEVDCSFSTSGYPIYVSMWCTTGRRYDVAVYPGQRWIGECRPGTWYHFSVQDLG